MYEQLFVSRVIALVDWSIEYGIFERTTNSKDLQVLRNMSALCMHSRTSMEQSPWWFNTFQMSFKAVTRLSRSLQAHTTFVVLFMLDKLWLLN